jgi:hypothetical protein
VSTIDRIAIRRVAVERATVISGGSFDAVLAKLAAAVGHPDMSAFARDVVAAGTSADLERIVEAATAPVTVPVWRCCCTGAANMKGSDAIGAHLAEQNVRVLG